VRRAQRLQGEWAVAPDRDYVDAAGGRAARTPVPANFAIRSLTGAALGPIARLRLFLTRDPLARPKGCVPGTADFGEAPTVADGEIGGDPPFRIERDRFGRIQAPPHVRRHWHELFRNSRNVEFLQGLFCDDALRELILGELEAFYARMEAVSPEFAKAKQQKKDDERAEHARNERDVQKEVEEKIKFEKALERARMPIKRRTGRQLVGRMLPIDPRQKDAEKCHAEMLEHQRVEQLLYGDE